jgi:hypothetical protein
MQRKAPTKHILLNLSENNAILVAVRTRRRCLHGVQPLRRDIQMPTSRNVPIGILTSCDVYSQALSDLLELPNI